MNIRLLLAISLTIALSSLNNLHAQFYAGLSGGYTDNSLSASTGYRSFTRYQPRGGFVLSVPIQYHFNEWFALGADLSYIQKITDGNAPDFCQEYTRIQLILIYNYH